MESWRTAYKPVRPKKQMQGSLFRIRMERYGRDKIWNAMNDRLKIWYHTYSTKAEFSLGVGSVLVAEAKRPTEDSQNSLLFWNAHPGWIQQGINK